MASEPARPSRVYFPALDGYRAIAALSVLVFHVLADTEVHTQSGYVGELTFALGNYGVTIFFVLSGFLLYRPYLRADVEGHEPPAFGPYLRTRLLRIVPAYWAALTAVILLDIERPDSVLDVVTFYGFAQIYRSTTPLDGLGVAWTLNIEMAFYVVMPLIALLVRRLPGRPARRQAFGIAMLVVIAWAYRAMLVVTDAPQHYSFFLPGYLDWFAAGMALAWFSVIEHHEARLPRLVAVLARHPWMSLVLAAECYWLLIQMNLPVGFVRETDVHYLLRFPVAGLSAMLLLLPGVLARNPDGRLMRFLQIDALRTTGMISYGIYLWHLVVIRQLDTWQADGWFPTSTVVVLPIVLLATYALAAMSYVFIEMPIMDAGRARWSHAPRRPVARQGTELVPEEAS